ncbi:DinB family protein [Mucilaginibacter sp. HC2]|uniref:DinB family protein n=1 Tax=Mucilaginibacter inviolabilis TaxID=2714892 RepID=UPI001408A936|nr:DinB family protein [Mucilaginibacter inviolabilis]NHA02449.1 DinB family protein [Mucilaginibacter inviolabilis]
MTAKSKTEVWLRGPWDDVPGLLQPVAHALLQAREELQELMADFPDRLLWQKVAGMASPGFHLQHLTGVLNRLFTYARGEMLTAEQLDYLSAEGNATENITTAGLVQRFDKEVSKAIAQLLATDEQTLKQFRGVGRAQLPSTVIGLYVHSAEHTMRHLGQLLVTVKVLRNSL